MQRAKSFLFVCLGILALAVAYHFGATTATAQACNEVAAVAYITNSQMVIVTSNGDVYTRGYDPSGIGFFDPSPIPKGNYWGGPTPAQHESWGAVKQRYR